VEGMPPERNTFLTRSFNIGNYSGCFADLASSLLRAGNGNYAFDCASRSDRNPFTSLEKNGKEEPTKVFILFDSYGSVLFINGRLTILTVIVEIIEKLNNMYGH